MRARETEAPTPAEILGVRVHSLGLQSLLEIVSAWSVGDTGRTILYVNAHCLNLAYTDKVYRSILNSADLVYPDGVGVVWGGRWLSRCRMEKITGADWIGPVCALASERGLRIYILAGKPGIAGLAAENLHRRWPDLRVVGTADGFFTEKSEAQVLAEICRSTPHILFVGMGAPRQEKWLLRHRAGLPIPVCWSVGALFDFVAGVEPRVPAWMDSLALEWLWRFCMDPRGKWKRYLIGNPLFILRLFRQKLHNLHPSPDRKS